MICYKKVKENENIKFSVDSFVYDNEKDAVEFGGWVFSTESEKIDILVEEAEVEKKEQFDREDVFLYFDKKYEGAKHSGYHIRVKSNGKEKITVKFCADNEDAVIKLDVKNINKETKIFKIKTILSVFTLERIRNTFIFLKREGLTNTIARIKLTLSKAKNNANKGYDPQLAYKKWIIQNETYDIKEVNKNITKFKNKPLISILMPVYNVEEKWLRKCINSVIEQFYENWELCIADDCSTMKSVENVLKEYEKKDKRIKVVYRSENGHISRATNSALEIAKGEYVALLDNDDEIPKFALYEVVKEINKNPSVDLIYSDEDKISLLGERIDPHFKPNFSPDTLLSSNYISHFGVYRKKIVDEIGGFRIGYEGAQDYDLVLRFTEKTNNVAHIPKILYNWRIIPGSTALGGGEKSYAVVAGYKALQDTIKRRKYNAEVDYLEDIPYYDVKFMPKKDDFVSIIIPTKDKADVLEKCLKSIYEKTIWNKYEIIVVDNNSNESETFELFEKYKNKYDNFRVLTLPIPFNYSKINNEAAKIAKGNLLLFLNNDVEVITEDWLERMAGYAGREEVGCVGAKLFYPNNTIQHAGVLLGVGGVANHTGLNAVKEDNGYFARNSINYNYSAVTAACLMVKKSVFEEVNGFEEKLQVAFNDVDFCIRVLKSGRNNVYLSKVQLYHYESISRGKEDSPEKIERFKGEIKYMREHWSEVLDNDAFYSPNFDRTVNMYQIKN